MTMYVYHSDGNPAGFLHSNFIYDLGGEPLGRVVGTRVHRFDGSYVGEFHKQTVVDRPVASRRSVQPVAAPPRQRAPEVTGARRGVIDYGFPDVFAHLRRSPNLVDDDRAWRIAAE